MVSYMWLVLVIVIGFLRVALALDSTHVSTHFCDATQSKDMTNRMVGRYTS